MTSVTSFLLKHLYELMADPDDSNDSDLMLMFLADNQWPDLICDTFVELISLSVIVAMIWISVAIIELHEPSEGVYQKWTQSVF